MNASLEVFFRHHLEKLVRIVVEFIPGGDVVE